MRMILLALVLIALATPALAVDGVLEINQTCAVQTGCFSGDDPGFPVTISASGSYRLTTNLNHGGDDDGIFLRNGRLTIDFNGFSLIGSAFGSGTGNGIAGGGTNGDVASYTTIKNGVIRLARGRGVDLGGAFSVHIEDMTVESSSSDGIRVGDGAKVLKNTFRFNGTGASSPGQGLVAGASSLIDGNIVIGSGDDGINTGSGSTVTGNTASNNGGNGINASTGSTISGNTASQNGGDGINGIGGGFGSTISGNTARSNGNDGISVGVGSTVSGNTAHSNGANGISGGVGSTISGNTTRANAANGINVGESAVISDNASYENTLDGIGASSGCTIRGNSVRGNDAWGLDIVSTTSAYRENTISTSGGTFLGTVNGGTDAGGNLCNGSLTCP